MPASLGCQAATTPPGRLGNEPATDVPTATGAMGIWDRWWAQRGRGGAPRTPSGAHSEIIVWILSETAREVVQGLSNVGVVNAERLLSHGERALRERLGFGVAAARPPSIVCRAPSGTEPVVSAFAIDDLAALSWTACYSGAMFMRMVALLIVGIVFSFPTFAGTELPVH